MVQMDAEKTSILRPTEVLANELERLARALRNGDLNFPHAVVVFHENQSRAVFVKPLNEAGSAAARDNATLAALQRAVVRWSIPVE